MNLPLRLTLTLYSIQFPLVLLSGVFTFFVLYDHFHHPHSAINQDFTADTYLFIMISGEYEHIDMQLTCTSPLYNHHVSGRLVSSFISLTSPPHYSSSTGYTTSLQLREVPVFVKKDSTSNNAKESSIKTSGQAPIAPLEQIEAGNKDEGYRLMPRPPLNFNRFMMNRLVGLLPIMWLGLFLNLPSWTTQANQPMKTKVRHDVMWLSVIAILTPSFISIIDISPFFS